MRFVSVTWFTLCPRGGIEDLERISVPVGVFAIVQKWHTWWIREAFLFSHPLPIWLSSVHREPFINPPHHHQSPKHQRLLKNIISLSPATRHPSPSTFAVPPAQRFSSPAQFSSPQDYFEFALAWQFVHQLMIFVRCSRSKKEVRGMLVGVFGWLAKGIRGQVGTFLIISCFVFRPAPYHTPVAVIAATEQVSMMVWSFLCWDMAQVVGIIAIMKVKICYFGSRTSIAAIDLPKFPRAAIECN